jgi:hypothetical protein
MNSVMARWIGGCRSELLDRTLVWNQRHLMIVLREYEDFYNTHRPHRALKQAAPLRPLPDGVADLDQDRVRRRDRAGGVIHEYRLVAYVFGTHKRLHDREPATRRIQQRTDRGSPVAPEGQRLGLIPDSAARPVLAASRRARFAA